MLRAVLLLAVLCAAAPADAARPARVDTQQRFDAGVDAYRTGHYEAALKAFLDARKGGLKGPNVEFNLGLAYYQLGKYGEARIAFERVRHNLGYTAVADYHLGLIAAQLGEREQASHYFHGARSMSTAPGLRYLADTAAMRLNMLETTRVDDLGLEPDARWYLLGGVGYDSNPLLVNDSLQPSAEDVSTAYGELSGSGDYALTATDLGTTSVRGDVWMREYQGQEDLDQQGAELGLRQDWRGDMWRLIGGIDAGGATLGDSLFQRTSGVSVEGRRGIGDLALRLRYRLQRIDGADDYGYLDGVRHRAGVTLAHEIRSLRLKESYELEYNDRRDLDTGDEFFSHSPTRHWLGVAVGLPTQSAVSLELRTRYRVSRYRGVNRFDDGTSTTRERREENLFVAGFRARVSRRMTWNGLLDYQYSNNGSSIRDFEYDRHLLLFGVEWLR